MVLTSRLLLAGLIGGMAACAPVPTAPYVMALPGPDRTLEQFQTDDTFCRQWASQRDQETGSAAAAQAYWSSFRQQSYDMAYLQCMYAKGNRIPGIDASAPATPSAPVGEPQPPPRHP